MRIPSSALKIVLVLDKRGFAEIGEKKCASNAPSFKIKSERMETHQELCDLLGFYPAKYVSETSRSYVSYYVLEPATGKFVRKRIYLNRIKDPKERKRYATELIKKLNAKLKEGWNPLTIQRKERMYVLFIDALHDVVEYKKAYIRKASIRQYDGRVKVIEEFLKKNDHYSMLVYEFDERMARDLMDYIFKVKKHKGITYNNYMADFKTFFNAMVEKGYLTNNPFKGISRMPEQNKVKQPFTKEQSQTYVDWVKEHDYDFWIVSGYTYYCALRPNEIVQLKVKNVNFEQKYIEVPAECAKSRKYRRAPIAKVFLQELEPYLKKLPGEMYLATGHRKIRPGFNKTFPTRIGERFRVIADTIGLPKDIFFYSLKDTCAERLLEEGFSTQDVRDLFGHSSIAITDNYLRKRNAYKNEKLANNFPKL